MSDVNAPAHDGILSTALCLLEAAIYIAKSLFDADKKTQAKIFLKIQTYVLVTILILVLQLCYLMKPFAYGFFRLLSWGSYFLVPALISYIIGLMMQPQPGYDLVSKDLSDSIRYLTSIWVIFLLFAYAGFDNLNTFSIKERSGRSKLFLNLGIQFVLLLLILTQLPPKTNLVPIAFVLLVLSFKFLERLVALAHSDGATPRIKREVGKIIDFTNDESLASDQQGCNYLVGPKYSRLEGKKIVSGITVEKIWGCQESLLLGNKQIKDNCLSFALFWLLLGKFWSYPLYKKDNKYSRAKARKLIRDELLGDEGEHERVFRVIEIELSFLRDYFHAKYIYFYLNGFYWKLISVVASPIMFWWFTQKAVHYHKLKDLGYTHPGVTYAANMIILLVIFALEMLQLFIFVTSRWTEVALVCHYVEKKSKSESDANGSGLWCRFVEMIGLILLGSSCNSTNKWWRKPWKRDIGQYSFVESCTSLPKGSSFLKLHVVSILGLPLPKPGRKQSPDITLPEQVKKALVLSLRENVDLKLTNGVSSLMRNGVYEELSWACMLKRDAETIIVWHIATSVCEIHLSSLEQSPRTLNTDMKVATSLSKYCAYLLFFASSLLPVPALEAESMCDDLIEEASELFNESGFTFCGKTMGTMVKYEKMKELVGDREIGSDPKSCSVLRKGVKLGFELVNKVTDEDKRWKILAELWTEMMLYLTPSNNNQTAHAEKLSQGGEFITHLWALLIHAGITDRDDMAAAFHQDDDVVQLRT